jgi:hypothetical protein
MRHFSLCVVLLVSISATAQDSVLQFVFTSDVHYGITRSHFRGADSVSAVVVNRAMIAAINCLPASRLPADGGVGAGIRLLFVNCWPDSMEQVWMDKQLASLPAGAPILLFTHSNPGLEARFFTNPNGNHGIDSTSRFENLLPEVYQDGNTLKDSTLVEQRELAGFFLHHPAIKAYFHGHNNFTQFYQWQGPDRNISLPCFRVDSPMKGRRSAKDETLVSFEVITIDTRKRTMTVREYCWNPVPEEPAVVKWGQTSTIEL